MKNHIITISLFAATLLVLSCEKVYDGPNNPKPRPEVPEEPVLSDITSIYSLNQKEGYVNSHHSEWKTSFIEMDFSSCQTFVSPKLTAKLAYYPRIKQLANGAYMLTYQQNSAAHDVYYGLSNDFRNWNFTGKHLFEKVDYKEIDPACPDPANARILYSSADFVVLDNGDILAFAAYRYYPEYTAHTDWCGIMMRKSTDNGKSWSAPKSIYRGSACWEPSALQLADGEIHVYYTKANPSIGDSGTALLRSSNRGETWTDVGYVIRQEAGVGTDNVTPIYTDQMPVAVQLNESEHIAVALESRFGRTGTASDEYHISLAWSPDNWASGGLAEGQTGPVDRADNVFKNEAGPYIGQFRSGETVLSTGISKVFNVRMGNATAERFTSPVPFFASPGVWGSLDVAGSHTMLAAFNYRADENGELYGLQIARFVLNHRVNATQFTPAMTGSSDHWKDVDDALFIGSEMNTSSVFRFAYDDTNIYCLVERVDEKLSSSDGLKLMFQGGNGTGTPFVINFTSSVEKGTMLCDSPEVKFKANVMGAFDDVADDDGIVLEISIPRTLVNMVNDKLLFNAVLVDEAGTDTFTGLTDNNYNRWLPIVFKAPQEPKPLPEDGNYEGPVWGEGEEQNPW